MKTSKVFSTDVARALSPASRYFFLGTNTTLTARFGNLQSYICTDLQGWDAVFAHSTGESRWICASTEKADLLLKAVVRNVRKRPNLGDLVLLQRPKIESLPPLQAIFRRVVGAVPSFKMLPPNELFEVLKAPEEQSRDLFIGGSVDSNSETLTLTRGNLDAVVVPFSTFRPSGTHSPNWGEFEVTDYGNTVRLGEYEASADAILYETDADFRIRLDAKRRREDKGFGASLRRLRIQRQLGRSDFQSISAKTIARIERGETAKPHGKTLTTISDILGVQPEQIESY